MIEPDFGKCGRSFILHENQFPDTTLPFRYSYVPSLPGQTADFRVGTFNRFAIVLLRKRKGREGERNRD